MTAWVQHRRPVDARVTRSPTHAALAREVANYQAARRGRDGPRLSARCRLMYRSGSNCTAPPCTIRVLSGLEVPLVPTVPAVFRWCMCAWHSHLNALGRVESKPQTNAARRHHANHGLINEFEEMDLMGGSMVLSASRDGGSWSLRLFPMLTRPLSSPFDAVAPIFQSRRLQSSRVSISL